MFMRSRQSSYAVQRPHTVWIKRAVVIGVLVGFVGLVSYVALNRDNITTEELNPTLVQAPIGTIKERAVEPGGMEVPHQDKEVFDLLSGQGSTEVADVVIPAEETAPVVTKTQPVADAAKTQAAELVKAPTPVVKAEPVKAEPIKAAAPQTAAPKAAEVAKAAPTGWAVQLGSFTKEADAQKAINTFRTKHTVLTNLQPHVRRVELEKGTYYRVMFGGLPNSTAASAVCAELKKQNQGCLNVRL